MTDDLTGQAGAYQNGKIEITPEMVKAGIIAAREYALGEPLEKLVTDLFLAMALESDEFARLL